MLHVTVISVESATNLLKQMIKLYNVINVTDGYILNAKTSMK